MKKFFNFDEIFGDFGFNGEFMKNIQQEFTEIEELIKTGKLKGQWDVQKIDEPTKKGYVIQGSFWSNQLDPSNPLDPLYPWERRPMPKRPFELPKTAMEEIREPLADVFEDDKTVKIYVELPGEEKEDIQLNVTEDKVEIKTKKFYKTVSVPIENINIEKTSSKYKNGLLEVTIPKKEKSQRKGTREIKID